MMKRILTWALILIIACMPVAACAADDYDAIIGGILAHLSNGADLQDWVDTTLSAGAGSGTDNLIPALLRLDSSLNFANYIEAINAKLDTGIKSASTRQRSALMLHALHADANIPDTFADDSIGELGVMSYIFGLHLLNNGFKSAVWTTDTLIEKLISLQLEDGGWAVSGKYADVDVSSMCLQAMACCDSKSEAFEASKQRALAFLAAAQDENGGYSSYGKPACESNAQVIIALLSLGIDPLSDDRFIKNGNTALDAMLSYRLENGGFSHLANGEANTMATVQALCALVALQNPNERFFDFDNLPAAVPEADPGLPLWKAVALGVIGAIALLGTIISLCKKRARGKRLILLYICCAIAVAAVWLINIQTASDYYGETQTSRTAAGQVWLSIRCDQVAGRADNGSTPEDGYILPRTQIDFYEGDSVFDVLTHAARQYQIHMEYEGASSDLTYLKGINYLYEYDYGDLSGWMYFVNGEEMSVGCGSRKVQNGDEILWNYTLSMGEDLR